MRRIAYFIAAMILVLSMLTGCLSSQPAMSQGGTVSPGQKELELKGQIDALEAEKAELQKTVKNLERENTLLVTNNAELQKKVDDAAPWFALSELDKEKELKRLEEEQAAKEAAEKKAAEEAQKAKEEEEKRGYDTNITYSQLARTPDEYFGKKVKFKGVVLQVIEVDDSEVHLRIATKGKYDNVVYAVYPKDIISYRILEDDKITIMGISGGIYSYQSTGGGPISIPLIFVDKIE